MTWEKYFNVAGHHMVVRGRGGANPYLFPMGFRPFERKENPAAPLFTLETGIWVEAITSPFVYRFQFEELDIACEFSANVNYFEFRMFPSSEICKEGEGPFILQMPRGQTHFSTNLSPDSENLSLFNFLLWNAFGVASACFQTIALHSSVIVYQDQAVLFLGESGTGKSTHTRLWVQAISGSKLLNDDSPVIQIIDQHPRCFGSPWSGKGNCYWNLSFPIVAIVRLRQAPFNKIRKLSKLEAFQAVYPSCPPSFAIDSELTDNTCKTLSSIIKNVPVYLLDCLPDREAAQLACSTIFSTVFAER
jgi:hypothetical protein